MKLTWSDSATRCMKGKSMNRLQGRVAIVTGATGGVGAAVCAAFTAEGATVLPVDIAGDDCLHLDVGTEAGNRELNMFLWMPPGGDRAGDILLADSTIFTTLFGGDKSLECFWKNLAIN